MDKLKRYVIFLVGLFVNSLGVSFVTKANLGTSPISSIPYVLSLNFPMTLGNFTILFSLLLIGLQRPDIFDPADAKWHERSDRSLQPPPEGFHCDGHPAVLW